MFVLVAVLSFLAWSIGLAVLKVPGGPIHLLLLLAGASLGVHVLQRRRSARRTLAAHRAANPDRDRPALLLRQGNRRHTFFVS